MKDSSSDVVNLFSVPARRWLPTGAIEFVESWMRAVWSIAHGGSIGPLSVYFVLDDIAVKAVCYSVNSQTNGVLSQLTKGVFLL